MLDLITKSKIRQKMILLFMNNKGEDYYINQIARIIGTTSGTTQRELNKLLKNSLVTHERKGNLVLYKLNESHPLLKEIESIVNKTIGIEVVLKEELTKLKGLEYAFIFGSYVKGDFNAKSDLDVYIIGDVNNERLHAIIDKMEKMLQKEVNPHVSLLSEFKQKLNKSYFIKDITQKYLLVVGDENEFAKIIKRVRNSG